MPNSPGCGESNRSHPPGRLPRWGPRRDLRAPGRLPRFRTGRTQPGRPAHPRPNAGNAGCRPSSGAAVPVTTARSGPRPRELWRRSTHTVRSPGGRSSEPLCGARNVRGRGAWPDWPSGQTGRACSPGSARRRRALRSKSQRPARPGHLCTWCGARARTASG